ncbi:hypothetical protein [Peribacillus butanolivorans]|uniref:hypothetical protein n=1 Tax=Peribacillus butanolivorans TaxID=421767 RepID=UPI0038255E55
MVKKEDLIFCYDIQLHRKIKREGYSYLTSAISLSDRKFWLYPRCIEIENIMKEHTKALNQLIIQLSNYSRGMSMEETAQKKKLFIHVPTHIVRNEGIYLNNDEFALYTRLCFLQFRNPKEKGNVLEMDHRKLMNFLKITDTRTFKKRINNYIVWI